MKDLNVIKVLVVDDSATMRMLISLIIRKTMHGITVTEAVNGLDALTKMQEHEFDLVLTDMVMPEMDGLQMIDRIRRSLKKAIPIVMVTSKGEEKERDIGLSHGADDYIVKPVNPRHLKETVTKLLGCRQRSGEGMPNALPDYGTGLSEQQARRFGP